MVFAGVKILRGISRIRDRVTQGLWERALMQRSTGTLVMLGLGKSRMPIVGSGCGEIESSRRQEGRRFSGGVDRQREFY
jgi:hypothetical protein